MDNVDTIFDFVGRVIAYGGGGAAAAYLLFQYLGKSWIENRFAERLEQLRHQQALELQRLRVEIDALLSGAIRIQEKEFEKLPEAWSLFDEAYGRVSRLVSPAQEYPDLDRMTSGQLEEFLSESELYDSQKQEMRESSQRLLTYRNIIFLHRLQAVKQACADFHNYVVRNGIFFPAEIKTKFIAAADVLWLAVTSKQIGHQSGDYRIAGEGWKKIKEEVQPLHASIEAEIHARLQAHAKRN